MARGFIRGALWGVGVSLIAVTMLSVIDDMPESTPAVGLASTAINGSGTPGANRGRNGDGPSAASLSANEVSGPEPDKLSEMLADAMSPAAVPDTGTASDLNGATAPEDAAPSGIPSASPQPPALQNTNIAALETPETERDFSVSADIVQPPVPEAQPQSAAFEKAAVEPQMPKAEEAGLGDAAEAVQSALAQPEGAEKTASIADISRNPAQPDMPVAPAVSTAFDTQQETQLETPEGGNAAPAEPDASASDASVAKVVEVSPESEAEMAPDVSLERGPEFVQTAVQPEQETELLARALPGDGSLKEAAAPVGVPVADLPAPDPAESGDVEKDTTLAPVDAETVVVVPEAAPGTDRVAALPEQIEMAPEVPDSVSLPDVGASETAVTAPAAITNRSADEPQEQPVGTEKEIPVNRLPTLGPEAPDAGAEDVEAVAADVTPSTEPVAYAPVERYAAAFEMPEEKPLMAVVLMDQGGDLDDPGTGLAAVRALPYPVSFAVDALAPDAAERMAAYRASGFEVLAMIDLPDGAKATDAEVNVSAALETLPEVIGVLEGVGTGIQTTPMAGRQVAQILAQTGHGLVTQNRGLNTVQKLAAREGVPSNIVFREFDAKSQSERVIRRFMDQAAFRAGQEGSVIMLGRLREETLAALLSWALQDRASTVAMAPVSAVLLQEQGL